MLPNFLNSIALWTVAGVRFFVLLVRAACRWRHGVGGIIMTRKNRSTRRKACPSVTLFTVNLKFTGLRSNPVPRGQTDN